MREDQGEPTEESESGVFPTVWNWETLSPFAFLVFPVEEEPKAVGGLNAPLLLNVPNACPVAGFGSANAEPKTELEGSEKRLPNLPVCVELVDPEGAFFVTGKPKLCDANGEEKKVGFESKRLLGRTEAVCCWVLLFTVWLVGVNGIGPLLDRGALDCLSCESPSFCFPTDVCS
jgi:hypothetical protein